MRNSIFLKPVHPSGIDVLMKDSAPGHDGITLHMLKLSLSSIKTHITHSSNLSLSEGVFPVELKIANVIILLKADDPMIFDKYMPVSLLCVLSKVFGKIMYSRLMSFWSSFFRKKANHYTCMAIMILTDKFVNSTEKMIICCRCVFRLFKGF